MKRLILAFSILLSQSVFSQIAHDLEIYSEDGLKFTLIIDGRTMNSEPMSNIQITNTNKDYVNMKLIFEDATIPQIEKKFLQIASPGTEQKVPVSCVYKIVKKKEEYKLAFASRSEKKIQEERVIIDNSAPSNGRIVISW